MRQYTHSTHTHTPHAHIHAHTHMETAMITTRVGDDVDGGVGDDVGGGDGDDVGGGVGDDEDSWDHPLCEACCLRQAPAP